MQRRALTAVALAFAVTAAPALRAQNRNMPGPDTPRLLVVVFQSGAEHGIGVQVADAVRARFTSQMNPRQLYITPREQMVHFLESSGYKADSSLGATDLKELAKGLRADEILGGVAMKNASGDYHIEPRLMLATDPTYGQPLPVIETGNLNEASRQIERAAQEARKQLADDRACKNHIRAGAMDKAIVAANSGIQKYPNAVIARLCLANAYQANKMWDSVLSVTAAIKKLDPQSKLANTFAFNAYKAKADAEPDSVKSQQYREASVNTLVELLATDPMNQTLQNNVIQELAKLGQPAKAIPIVDQLLKQNPGDPPLLKSRWLLMLADAANAGADSAMKGEKFTKAVAAGENMVKADSTLGDSSYFQRQVFAAMTAGPQLGVEWTTRATRRYPTNQDYWWYRAREENMAGQIQAAQQSVSRLLSLNPKYPLANVMLGQLFLQQGMTDSAVALARRAVSAGEDKQTWGNFLLAPARDATTKAQNVGQDSTRKANREDVPLWESALSLSQEADKLSPSPTSKFLVGVTSFQVGIDAVQQSQKLGRPPKGKQRAAATELAKACDMAKRAQDMFLLTQLNMPAGGALDKTTAQNILGYVAQYSPAADQMATQFCKK